MHHTIIVGIALAAKSMKPDIKIIAAEPEGMNSAADVAISLKEGELQPDVAKPKTLADGLQAKMGDLTWSIVR